jgi:hypothetical protein
LVNNSTDYIIELKAENLIEFPEVDTTIIKLEKQYQDKIRKISLNPFPIGVKCKMRDLSLEKCLY